jgi:alpha-D-glucose phosphate-specific phosphoglucomutase
MAISPLAGRPAPAELLIDPAQLERAYAEHQPDLADPQQLVSFGTSGHRGTPLDGTFTDAHIAAITQAICEYRQQAGITGPLWMGKDTHAISGPAQRTALAVLAAHGVEVFIQADDGPTPTPVISHAILRYNHGRSTGLADGIIITPSHNPPQDGGFKYNPPNGGPADVDVTQWIQDRANAILRGGNREVRRLPDEQASRAATTHQHDYITPYVEDLASVIDSGSHPRCQHPAGRRSAGRLGVGLLGADPPALRAKPDGGQPRPRPPLCVYAGRSRRANPHGLLQPLCHDRADRPERPLPGGLRQRPRRRPARHRRAQRRPA